MSCIHQHTPRAKRVPRNSGIKMIRRRYEKVYRVEITKDGKTIWVGDFSSVEEALIAKEQAEQREASRLLIKHDSDQ